MDSPNVNIAKQYYILSDQGRPVVDLFAEDATFYFPKFGIGTGTAAFLEGARGLAGFIESMVHDMDTMRIADCGDTVVVEGTTRGRDRNGIAWAGGETPGGRYCTVFEFRNGLITRMHVYLDPDFTSADAGRFHWGRDRQW